MKTSKHTITGRYFRRIRRWLMDFPRKRSLFMTSSWFDYIALNQSVDCNRWGSYLAPSQYPKRRLSVRSRKVSKPRDLYLELSDRSEIWQALRQQCCRCACQISKRYDNLKYQSRGFETLRDLTKRRLFGYWDGALAPYCWEAYYYHYCWEALSSYYIIIGVGKNGRYFTDDIFQRIFSNGNVWILFLGSNWHIVGGR